MTTKMKHNLGLVAACVFALILVVVAVLVASPRNVASVPVGEVHVAQNAPVAGIVLPLTTLDGDWSYKKDQISFNAHVQNNHIKITMLTADDTSAVYWQGSFNSSASGSVITSNREEGENDIILSQAPSKDFTVGENTLTFTFEAMGFSTKVALSR